MRLVTGYTHGKLIPMMLLIVATIGPNRKRILSNHRAIYLNSSAVSGLGGNTLPPAAVSCYGSPFVQRISSAVASPTNVSSSVRAVSA